jgi:uncharacterized protein (DUF983 family)
MGRECTVCGRGLITGRKYCYQHRGHREEASDSGGGSAFFGILFVIGIVILFAYMVYGLIYWTGLSLSWIWQNLFSLIGVSLVIGGWFVIGYFVFTLCGNYYRRKK